MNILQIEIIEDEEEFLHMRMEEMIKIGMVSHLQMEEDVRMELPPEPARFTDWSSISSPPAVIAHGMPGVSVEPSEKCIKSIECARYRNNQIRKNRCW